MKILASVIVIAFAPLSLFAAQNNPNGVPQKEASDGPVIYTLEFDDEMIEALRDGQSLISVIPESIRGQVDKVRIEYKPSKAIQPQSKPSSGVHSILNNDKVSAAPERFDPSKYNQTAAVDDNPPPLTRPTSLGLNLQRSGGSIQQDNLPATKVGDTFKPSTSPWQQPASNNFDLNNNGTDTRTAGRGLSQLTDSTRKLTPIDGSSNGLWGTRSDSNATFAGSSSSSYNPNLTRSPFENTSPSVGSISAPPISRSTPQLDAPRFPQGMATSETPPLRFPADNQPGWDTNQSLSKVPADTFTSAILGANDSATRADNRTLSYLFMLLLCSIGLNVYLGWISRGFYVRYHELAAELRETFTPSNAA